MNRYTEVNGRKKCGDEMKCKCREKERETMMKREKMLFIESKGTGKNGERIGRNMDKCEKKDEEKQ